MPNDKTYICKEDLLEKMQYRLPVEDAIEAYSIYECVNMDYHASAKKIVSVFLSRIVPVLKEMEESHGQ